MIAAIGGFVGLIVFIGITIIASLLKKRPEFEDLPPELKPRRGPQQQPPARNWEEELRRVLEGQILPPVVQQAPPPRPVARPVPPPIPVAEPGWDDGGIEVSLPVPQPNITPRFQQLPGLMESTEKYASATHLQERVAQHMAGVIRHPVGTTSAHRIAVPLATTEVVRSLRAPQGARAAIIAAIILGPPRALEG